MRGAALALLMTLGCSGSTGPGGLPGDVVSGEPGEPGEAGTPAAPIISAILPNEVFLGRVVDVVISGAGTDWQSLDDITVSFGEGVEILDGTLNLASPTALTATLRIDESAPLGLRNVNVQSGPHVAVFENTFNVDEPVSIGVFVNGGVSAQGSILQIPLFANDPNLSFATEILFDIPDTVQVHTPGGSAKTPVVAFGGLVEPQYAEYPLLLDVHMPPGDTDVVVEIGPEGYADVSTAPASLNVTKRTPKKLTPGVTTATTKTFGETILYELETETAGFISLEATSSGFEPPFVFLLPASGKWDELLAAGPEITLFVPEPTTFYVVLQGSGIEPELDLTITLTEAPIPLTTLTAGVPHLDQVAPPYGNYYPITATQGQTLTATVSDGLVHSCFGVPEIFAFLILHAEDGNTFVGDVGFPPCPSMQWLIPEDGTYYLRVEFDDFAPVQSFDYTITYDLQ